MSGPPPTGRLKARLAALSARLRTEAGQALAQAGGAMVDEARRRLAAASGPEPSAPGDPPRDRAGRLAASLGVDVDEAGLVVTVTAADPRARDLEYGTRTMAARPFLRPAAETVRPAALDACRAALARAATEESPS